MMNKKTFLLCLIGFILLITLPYLAAWLAGGEKYVFGGFLVNPIDGNSYFAKMQEGIQGSWKFTLPYTSGVARGEFIFLFYLFLGQLTRICHTTPAIIFHFIRILTAIWMVFELKKLFERAFPDSHMAMTTGFIWALFGAGMGWMLLPARVITADFWVAEGYPFLSAFVNPHFPLSIALLLFILRTSDKKPKITPVAMVFISSLIMAIIFPFGVIVGGIILFLKTSWEVIRKQYSAIPSLVAFGVGGAPYVFYQYLITQNNPALFQWNLQNLTPAPAIWDLILSFSPALILSLIGIWLVIKRREAFQYRTWLVWLIGSVILIYLPFNLQRRFIFGLYIPMIILAVYAFEKMLKNVRAQKIVVRLCVAVSVLTNILILLIASSGIAGKSDQYYMTRGEYDALRWISDNTIKDTIILASPGSGLLIPAQTGRRVIYGHPFETINAVEKERMVTNFWGGQFDDDDETSFINENDVSYVFYGPREKELGRPDLLASLKIVYQNDEVTIYGTDN
jgi:hypothetical protein